MNTVDFYNNLDLRYPEVAICLEDTNNEIGKFFIPILTPLMRKDEPFIEDINDFDKKNVINHKNLYISPVKLTNYIELKLPKGYTSAKKNDKFIVIFLGGDINKPILIGGYE